MPMQISVIVATYGREATLRAALTGLLAQQLPDSEIIVIDQTKQHEPETSRLLAESPIRHIKLEKASTPVARNAGCSAARGEIVLYVDDDAIPGPDLMARHLRCYADPTVAGVVGRVHLGSAADMAGYPWPDGSFPFDCNSPRYLTYSMGCNMSFRREILQQAGGFDEFYKDDCNAEDEDAGFAVRRLGYRLYYEPTAWVIHCQSPTGGSRTSGWPVTATAGYYRNKTYFALKNVQGFDVVRLLGDAYVSGTWHKSHFWRRQWASAQGFCRGLSGYLRSGWHIQRLPYRLCTLADIADPR